MKHKIVKILSIFSLLLIIGCYPYDDDSNVSDYDSVLTNFDDTFDFSVAKTYTLPPEIPVITDKTNEGDEPEYINAAYRDAILDAIEKNLEAEGWTRVADTDNPDIIMPIRAFENTYLIVSGGWWPWYGWGWWYPYPPTYVSGYKTGSVAIEMADTSSTNEDGEYPIVWLGAFNGLLQGSQQSILSRIDRNIDQAFKHAPFNN